MAYQINTQQTDSGGSRAYIKTTVDAATGNVVKALTGGFDDFSNYYSTLESKFGKDGFIKDIEYNGVKYSYLSNRPNLKKSGGWNAYADRGRDGAYYSKLPWNGLSVPNCTAWAYARILELMIITGLCYTKDSEKISGKTYITTPSSAPAVGTDQKNVQYSLDFVKTMLNCGDGRQFIDRWPSCDTSSQFPNYDLRAKWRAFGWGVNQTTPRPGCIVAWRGINNTSSWWVPKSDASGSSWESGFPGHVAVVEKVLNAGTDNESIIVSESNYSGGGTAWSYLVKMYEIKKKNNYGTGDYGLYNLRCLGFGYNPACDLIQGGAPGSPVNTTISWPIGSAPTDEQLLAYSELTQAQYDANNGESLPLYTDGAEVKIMTDGYFDKEGKKKLYENFRGKIGKILMIHPEEYIYNVEVGTYDTDKKVKSWWFWKFSDLRSPDTKPIILYQPINKSVVAGTAVSFIVIASWKKLTYQWFTRSSNSGEWSEIEGATSKTYTINDATTDLNNHQYKCDITNEGGTVTTNKAVLTVTNAQQSAAS